jgi:hypothetical protein
VVLRLELLVDVPYFFGSVVDREVALERNCDTFVESSIIHLPLIGLAGIRLLVGKKLHLFLIRHLPK